MKNLILLFVAFCISLCTFGQSLAMSDFYDSAPSANGSLGEPRSMAQAEEIARNFLLGHSPTGHSSHVPRYVDVSRMQLLRSVDVLRKASISTMKLADDAFYVFTDPQGSTPGFVIVSADESMDPILGFSYENCFVPDSLPEHIAAWLASYAIEYAQQISTDGCQGQSRLRAKSPEYSGSVDPILSVKWNQTDPYNRMCPVADGARTVTGCVATAMAQVMSVHQSPAAADGHISYTTSSKRIPIDEDLSRFHFDWNSIMNNHSAGFSSAVADLMYAVGVSVRMDYTTDGSGTSDVYIPTALHDNFGYDADMLLCEKSSMTNDEWYKLLISELKQGRPVVYSGITNSRSGHCFVTDGYRVESGEPKFHINWGWAGNCDGYYRIANLRPESAGVGGVNEAYSLSNSAVIGIKPDDGYQEHNGFWQARSITVMPAVVSPNSSDEVVITCSSLTNASLRDFEGSFAYYLVDNEGHATLLDTKNVSGKMGYHHVLGTMSHSLRVPSGLALGNYTIEVRSVSNGIERRVTSGMGDARITVSETKVTFPTDMMVVAVIPHPKSGRTVELEAVNPLNNSSTPFKGDLSMAITDTDGHIIQRIGNVVTLSSLEHWMYYTRSFVLSGSIPYDIPDGDYRLCLVSCQEGYDDWSTVHRYTKATSWNGSVYLDQLSLDGYVGLSIKNGLVNYDYSTMPHYAPQIVIQGSLQLASAQGRSATLSAQIGNTSSTSFFGEVRAAIADSRGNVLERSASNGLIVATELAQNRVYAITGLFSGTYADGEYKLVLLANQGGCADWSAVNSYNGGSSSCPIWIKDNCLYTSSVIDSSVLKSGSCGTNARYTIYDNLTMTITGTGAMDNYGKAGNVAPWREANLHGNIQSVSVAEGITSLGDYAFYDCSCLSQVEFPSSLRRIGESAFEGSSLGLLTLPQSIETLAEGACTGISHVDVAAGNANFASDHGVLYSADFKTLYYYPSSYQGPFVVPATVTAIAGKAFAAAGELTELRLPASLCSIGSDAFAQCKGLQCIYCMATTPPSVGNSAFLQVRKNIPVYVPAESIAVYGRASGWADFTSLKAYVVVQNIVLPFTTVDIELHETLHVEPSFNPVDATEVSIAWSSSNAEIASVDNSGNVTPHKFGTTIITARAVDVAGVESQMTVNVVPSMVKSITLNTELLELHYGEKVQLEATIEPEYATEKSVVWTSSDETIAIVDENGLVTAQRCGGAATITATTTDGTELRATCTATVLGKPDAGYSPYLSSRVNRIQSSNFNGRIMATYTYELRNNGSETIEVTKCTVMDADTRSILSTTSNGSELGTLEPDNAITRQQDTNYLPKLAFEWEYSYHGKTYVFQSWERYYADAESVELDQTTMTLERGTTAQLKATVLPTVAMNEVTWTTSNAEVATVDNTGLITAVGLGIATISATTTDDTVLSATCEVTVVPACAKSVTLSADVMDVVIGDAFTITAHVEPENAESKGIAWSIDNTDVVRMTAEGEFEAIGIGNATITATVIGTEVSASCSVNVLPVLVSAITLSQTAAELIKGETLLLTASVAPADATDATIIWTSSDTSVAEVDEYGLVMAKSLGTAVITATAADGSGIMASCSVNVLPVLVSAITLSQTAAELIKGESLLLTASVSPKDATNGNVRWASSDTSVAEVDENGLVTTKAGGAAVITATACDGSGVVASCEIVVIGKPDYGYNPYLSSRTTGYSYTSWTGYVYGFELRNNGNEDIVVTKCTIKDAATLATLSVGTDANMLGSLAPGDAISLSFKTWNESSLAFEWEYLYNDITYVFKSWERYYADAEMVTLSETSMTLERGTTAQLKATVLPTVAMNEVTWTTSNAEVATVDNTGLITAVGLGTATISATTTDETDLSATCEVTVVPVAAKSVTLSADVMDVVIGDAFTITAHVDPENAESKDIAWSIDNTDVVRMTAEGEFEAIGIGNATITATVIGTEVSASCSVNVLPVLVSEITLSQTAAELIKGESLLLTASVAPADATDATIIWTSSDTSVAEVDEYGLVTAKSLGTAVITATAADGSGIMASCSVNVLPVLVSAITLSQTAAELIKGETLLLTASVSPKDATNGNVRWASSDTSVAEVDENGLVTAKAGGAAVITATACDGSGVVASCEIVVIGKPDYGYNPYLSSRTTGYSYTSWTGYMYGFELRNNGEESIEVTKCTVMDGATHAVLTTSSDASLLGNLAAGEAKSLSYKSWNELGLVFEWEYSYHGKTYVFQSWERYYTDAESVVLDQTTMTLERGTTGLLKATILPSVAMQEVKWSSSDESIASVDAEGRVTGINIGKALITATTTDDTDLEAQCVVSVIPQKIMPTGLRLSVTEMSAAIDEPFTISATIEPEDSDFKQIEWSISNPRVIVMLADGEFVATGIGTATITATIVGTGVSATCEVTTYDPNVFAYYLKVKDHDLYLAIDSEDNDGRTNNVISAAHLSVKERASLLIMTEETEGWKIEDAVTHRVLGKSTRYSWNFSNMDTDAALWSVEPSDDALLLRGSNGYWKTNSVADGSYLYHDGRTRDLLWELIPVRETDISMEINCTSASLHVGESKQLTVAIVPLQVLQGGILWSSNNNAVATVSEEGLVTAISLGTAIITATLESNPEVKAMATITVKPIDVTSITLDKTSCELVLGQTATIKASINPTDATDKGILWSTDNALIATVTSNGTVKAVGKGTTTITATSKSNPDIKATLKVTVKATDVTSISLNKTACQIKVGESEELIATIAPNTATDKGIVWTSSNKTVATVSANGIVTALAEGTTTITASSHSNPEVKATATVQVVNNVKVESIYLDIEEFTIEVGYNRTLTVGFVPANADNTGISWISDNTTIARVDPVTGKIIGVSEGTAVITATSNDNPDAKVSVTVHVIDRNVKSITLNYTEYELWPGESVKLEAVVSPDNAKSKNVVWSTDNANVATVSSNGMVKAVAPGIVTITAKSDVNSKVSATATITVLGLATDISLNYSSYALAKGESVQLVAYVSPDVASQQPITWSSSNEGIITVNANGLCTCIGDGTATVTATTTDGSELSASCTFDCLVGINEVEVTALDEEFYSLDGIKHSRAKKGINVVRQKDGKTIKMFNSHSRQ